MALEAKALGGDVTLEACGDGVEVPATLVAVTATLRKMAKNSEDCITAIEQIIRQLRAPTKCLGPTPEESFVDASGSAELLARLENESWSEHPPLTSDQSVGSGIAYRGVCRCTTGLFIFSKQNFVMIFTIFDGIIHSRG